MRQIKFRRPHYSRDGKFIKFSYWGFIDGKAFIAPAKISGSTQKEDEQFTGLQDVNGADIYEGDVLHIHNFYFDGHSEAEAETKGVIEWKPQGLFIKGVTGWIAEHMGYEDGDPNAEAELCSIVPAKYMDIKDADEGLLLNKWGLHEESYTILGNIHEKQPTND